MALICKECVIGGVLQNGSFFSFRENDNAEVSEMQLKFQFSLDTDEEQSAGTRDVTFDFREIVEGTLVDGVIKGTLSGQWDVFVDDPGRGVDAVLETFSRRGELAFLVVTAQDEGGRTFFSANIRPTTLFVDPRRSEEMRGTVFLSWDDRERAGGAEA